MEQQEIEQIAAVVRQELATKHGLDPDLHASHHRFIENEIKRARQRQERNEQILRIVGGWGIIAALSGLVVVTWDYIRDHLIK